jgi:nucleotide-binding universal stress UspA family protein
MILLKKVLVATDFSAPSDAALHYGRALASQFDAVLHVLHVAEDVYARIGADGLGVIPTDVQQQIEDDARRRLHDLVIDQNGDAPPTIRVLLTSRSASATIVNYAKEHDIDVIVVGTHGRGAVAHFLIGSVAERVVRTAPCPVLTVRQPERDFVRPDAASTDERAL